GITNRSPSGGVFVSRAPLHRPEFDPAEDHCQLGRRYAQVGRIGRREGERPLLQPAEVEGKPVPLPGQDLETVPATIAEHVQVTTQRVPSEVIPDHGLEPVEALPAVLWLDTDPDSAGQTEGQHGPPPSAATSRATAAGSAPT